MARFALIVAAWLPIRAIVLLALYLHRAAVSEWNQPLHVMNQFLSPWVLLAMLVPPILLAWRWVRLLGDAPLPAAGSGRCQAAGKEAPLSPRRSRRPAEYSRQGEGRDGRESPPPLRRYARADAAGSLSVKYLAAAACCLFGTILVALGWQWEPIGTRKAGRVMIVEKHSPWSPSNQPLRHRVPRRRR